MEEHHATSGHGTRDSGVRQQRIVEVARLEVAGFLGRDAQVLKGAQREFVALSVGSSRAWRGADGQAQERTLWVKVLAFGEAAERLRDLKKGMPVYAVGPLSYDRWKDEQGAPRQAPVVRVTDRDGEVQAAPMPGGQFARVMLAGRLTRDAAVREPAQGGDGRALARLTVQARGQHAVQVQGPLVEHVAERLKAEHGLRLDGRLELQHWQDEAGQAHERVTIVVGGPETQLRVDRAPLGSLGREARPQPAPALDPPAAMPARERDERERPGGQL